MCSGALTIQPRVAHFQCVGFLLDLNLRKVQVAGDRRMAEDGENGPETCPKLRSGQPASGVEGHPGTGHPLDPEPGLGGTLSLGLLEGKASPFFHIFPEP